MYERPGVAVGVAGAVLSGTRDPGEAMEAGSSGWGEATSERLMQRDVYDATLLRYSLLCPISPVSSTLALYIHHSMAPTHCQTLMRSHSRLLTFKKRRKGRGQAPPYHTK